LTEARHDLNPPDADDAPRAIGPLARAVLAGLKVAQPAAWIAFVAAVSLTVLFWGFLFAGKVAPNFDVGRLTDQSEWPRVGPGMLSAVGNTFFVLIAVVALRGLFDTITRGEPFALGNPNRLRLLAVAVGGLEVTRWLTGIATLIFSGAAEPIALSFRISISAWVSVVVLFVRAEVFAEGRRLAETERLTI
jgi:hypothetical protein